MRKVLIFAIAGFLAQLVDGSLGMGFGASSSSILLTYGIAPAVVSATVHFSENCNNSCIWDITLEI